jgi:hypothetical protein
MTLTTQFNSRITDQLLRVGLNYKFDPFATVYDAPDANGLTFDKAPIVTAWSWAGPYLGVNYGYGWGKSDMPVLPIGRMVSCLGGRGTAAARGAARGRFPHCARCAGAQRRPCGRRHLDRRGKRVDGWHELELDPGCAGQHGDVHQQRRSDLADDLQRCFDQYDPLHRRGARL